MQLSLNFEPGLTHQYPELIELIAAVVYGSRLGLGGVASALDLSPSQLSRMLNRNADDPRNLPASAIPAIIEATDDRRIVYWFVERFLEDPETARRRAIAQLSELMPKVEQLIAQSNWKPNEHDK